MKKDKTSIKEKASEIFDLPPDALAGMPKITIIGCRQAFVENHKGVLEYNENMIGVNGDKAIVKFRGDKLELCSMNSEELLITGIIAGVDMDI